MTKFLSYSQMTVIACKESEQHCTSIAAVLLLTALCDYFPVYGLALLSETLLHYLLPFSDLVKMSASSFFLIHRCHLSLCSHFELHVRFLLLWGHPIYEMSIECVYFSTNLRTRVFLGKTYSGLLVKIFRPSEPTTIT